MNKISLSEIEDDNQDGDIDIEIYILFGRISNNFYDFVELYISYFSHIYLYPLEITLVFKGSLTMSAFIRFVVFMDMSYFFSASSDHLISLT